MTKDKSVTRLPVNPLTMHFSTLDVSSRENYNHMSYLLSDYIFHLDKINIANIMISLWLLLVPESISLNTDVYHRFVRNFWHSVCNAVFIPGVIASYGILNDRLAVEDSQRYFTYGHRHSQINPLRTPDKQATAVAWGILSTMQSSWMVALPYLLVSIMLDISGYLPDSGSLICSMVPALSITLFITDCISRFYKRQASESEVHVLFECLASRMPNNQYICKLADDCSKEALQEKINWEACNVRNSAGYFIVPMAGIGAAITSCVYRTFFSNLDAVKASVVPKVLSVTGTLCAVGVGLFNQGCSTYMKRKEKEEHREHAHHS